MIGKLVIDKNCGPSSFLPIIVEQTGGIVVYKERRESFALVNVFSTGRRQ